MGLVRFESLGVSVLVTLYRDVSSEALSEVKSQLVAANSDYDFCFLNTNHIVSTEHLYHSIYKSILNSQNGAMRAKTLNTEIIFNLSPINNIMDALKRFGVDTECPNLIAIKVLSQDSKPEEIEAHLNKILRSDGSVELNDEILEQLVNVQKVKKVYKLNDAKFDDSPLQHQLTRLAIGACIIRGN